MGTQRREQRASEMGLEGGVGVWKVELEDIPGRTACEGAEAGCIRFTENDLPGE